MLDYVLQLHVYRPCFLVLGGEDPVGVGTRAIEGERVRMVSSGPGILVVSCAVAFVLPLFGQAGTITQILTIVPNICDVIMFMATICRGIT